MSKGAAAIDVADLSKVYANKVHALKTINFSIEEGDFFALLGPNGAGKSTTIGILSGLVTKTSGQVRVCGYDLDKQPNEVKCQLGLVPQEFNFNAFEKVNDILIQQAGYYGIPKSVAQPRADKYLKQLDLWEKRDEYARTLSGGMKRRLMIARALVHEPPILILDEPTAGVDIEIRRSLWNFLREINANGTTIILTTHYLEEVEELCRKVAIIHMGEIVVNTSIKTFLRKLDKQSFILDLTHPLARVPDSNHMRFKEVDSQTLEVELPRNFSLNALFAKLAEEKIEVQGMRGKANRVETLFLDLIKKKGPEA